MFPFVFVLAFLGGAVFDAILFVVLEEGFEGVVVEFGVEDSFGAGGATRSGG